MYVTPVMYIVSYRSNAEADAGARIDLTVDFLALILPLCPFLAALALWAHTWASLLLCCGLDVRHAPSLGPARELVCVRVSKRLAPRLSRP